MPTMQRLPLIFALLLAAFSASACTPETDLRTREPADAQPVVRACPDPPAALEPAKPSAAKPSTRFTIHPPRTEVWSVIDGQCVELTFIPYHDQAGYIIVGGPTVPYEVFGVGDRIELFGLSKSTREREGEGRIHWSCMTSMQLGEDGRLGQADLFADRADCEAGLATAEPLDDSDELIKRKCSGEQLAVDTELECGPNMMYAVYPPGCISLIANDRAFGTPTPPRRVPPPAGPNPVEKPK